MGKQSKKVTDHISLARRSFCVGGCSIKITEDARKDAAERGLPDAEVIGLGVRETNEEFANAEFELYTKI